MSVLACSTSKPVEWYRLECTVSVVTRRDGIGYFAPGEFFRLGVGTKIELFSKNRGKLKLTKVH